MSGPINCVRMRNIKRSMRSSAEEYKTNKKKKAATGSPTPFGNEKNNQEILNIPSISNPKPQANLKHENDEKNNQEILSISSTPNAEPQANLQHVNDEKNNQEILSTPSTSNEKPQDNLQHINVENKNNEKDNSLYNLLTELHADKLVIYPDKFECPICICEYGELQGIILQECLHVFCRSCLVSTILASEAADVVCPFANNEYSCPSTILEHEIQSLLPQEAYENRLIKTLAQAEANIQNSFHCKTPDCIGWCICDGNDIFQCPVCAQTNCILCQAIHTGITCLDYLDVVQNKSESLASKQSEIAIKDLVEVGEAMRCPKCNAVVQRVAGCDALTCTICKTALCWATKGARWGPRGVGDTSGGCRCNYNSIKCHPKCNNCH